MINQKRLLTTSSIAIGVAAGLALVFCFPGKAQAQSAAPEASEADVSLKGAFDADDGVGRETKPETPAANETKKRYSPYAGRTYPTRVYFGDTHHHTANSGDAFMGGNKLTPEQAYRFARGEEVMSSSGVPAKLSRPLDFLVVSDHAEGLGLMFQVANGNPAFASDSTLLRWGNALKTGGKAQQDAMNELVSAQAQGALPAPVAMAKRKKAPDELNGEKGQ